MLYIIDDLYLMHDWYFSSTLVEALTSRLIGIHVWDSSFCGIGAWWCTCFGKLIYGICLMILNHWYYLIRTTIGICLIHG
jgi:hypothetical protein